MATSEGIPSSIDIEFLELNDNPYIIIMVEWLNRLKNRLKPLSDFINIFIANSLSLSKLLLSLTLIGPVYPFIQPLLFFG